MSGVLIVTGTDTGIGKTVAAAGIAAALGASYWKPVQAGVEDGTDSLAVAALGVPAERVLPEHTACPCPHRLILLRSMKGSGSIPHASPCRRRDPWSSRGRGASWSRCAAIRPG